MSVSGDRQVLTSNTNTAERGMVGKIRVSVTGTFDSATATARLKDPSGTMVSTGQTLTADGWFIIDAPNNAQNIVDVDLTGGLGSENVAVWTQSELDR